jgi:hypothetical protein
MVALEIIGKDANLCKLKDVDTIRMASFNPVSLEPLLTLLGCLSAASTT